MKKRPLQWHPAFQAVLQIELMEDREFLRFLEEYNLTKKPLQIDTLIIKMDRGKRIHKSFGRLFRQYNIVEYKSPGDYLSINDFFKVMSYAGFFQSSSARDGEIPPEELTVTLMTCRYPRKLLNFLKNRYRAEISEVYQGIYYVSGLLFPMQVVVIGRLSKDENIWLSRLRKHLDRKKDIEVLAREYRGKEKDPLYAAAMDLIVRANWKMYEEEKMCDALRELFADELQESERKGEMRGVIKGVEALILDNLEEGRTRERIIEKLMKRYSLDKTAAESYFERFGAEPANPLDKSRGND